MFSTTPKLCMVIGDPVSHSLSPALHNAGYRACGLSGKFVYVACRVSSDRIGTFVDEIRTIGIRGVSCTMPHKELVMPYLDHIDDVAKAIGAVNTIVNNKGILRGYNTDWIGMVAPLKAHTVLSGKRAAVIGAGGAAKAMVYGLLREGASVTIYNRTVSKAEELAAYFGCSAAPLATQDGLREMDIICNATSVGMGQTAGLSPINTSALRPGQLILDAIYAPYDTKLLQDAQAQGASVIHGTEMLLHQAMAQFELYTGQEAPEAAMRQALYAVTGQNGNRHA